MIDYGARREVTLVVGSSGTGKTSFCLRYLVNDRRLAWRALWDADGQLASRLGLAPAGTLEDLNASIEDGFTVFDPNPMFPGRHPEAFAWFCGWVWETAARIAGPKVLLVDEVWRYCSNVAIPQPLAECIQTGRVRGLSCMFATQRPNRLNEAILNETTECVAFRLQGANALRTIEDLGAPSSKVAALPPGAWISVGCQTGRRASGRLWGSVSGSRTD